MHTTPTQKGVTKKGGREKKKREKDGEKVNV